MRPTRLAALAGLLATLALTARALAAGDDPTRIGDVSTTFRVIGRNDRIVVDRYDDPRVDRIGGDGRDQGHRRPRHRSQPVQHRVPRHRPRHRPGPAAGERGRVRRLGQLAVQGDPCQPDVGPAKARGGVSRLVNAGAQPGRQPLQQRQRRAGWHACALIAGWHAYALTQDQAGKGARHAAIAIAAASGA